MRDPLPGYTEEEAKNILGGVLFAARNELSAVVGYGEMALEKLEPSHPSFELFKRSHEAAVRVNDVVQRISKEMYERRIEHDKRET